MHDNVKLPFKVYKGKQSVKHLIQKGEKLTNIEVTDQNIKSFNKTARKYGIDYSLKKDGSEKPPRYFIFFKAKHAEVMNAAFKDFLGKELKNSVIAKIRREQENAKKNHTFKVLCNYLHLLKDWRTEYAPKSAEEEPNPLFVKALTETDYIESLVDCFISGTKDDVAYIVKDENGSIAKIEKTVMKFSKHSVELVM